MNWYIEKNSFNGKVSIYISLLLINVKVNEVINVVNVKKNYILVNTFLNKITDIIISITILKKKNGYSIIQYDPIPVWWF